MDKEKLIWNLINSAIAGLLVFFGAFTSGQITLTATAIASAASIIVFLTKFNEWFSTTNPDTVKVFNFMN